MNPSLFIPIIQGTSRPQRLSIHVSKLVYEIARTIEGIETQLVDPLDFSLPLDGRGEELSDPKYTDIVSRADGFFLVVPEYNHGYPGSLKRLLDSELKLYKNKPVAFAGVSSGFAGGVRVIEQLLPVVRTLGMIALQKDIYFPNVQDIFDEQGNLLDEKYRERIAKKLEELKQYALAFKQFRENN